ncbi:MAG: PepSY domain-containing protein [Chitinophagaceae bacterium]|nr:PepSY domain-containing protein [Chitinophagaceae bacterium]
MRKKIYQLHRRLSIIIAIPVLLWAISGFMHPIMTNIRPAIATQGILSVPVDPTRIHISLADALRKHHIDSCLNFRLVHIDTNWFYQVQLAGAGGNAVPGSAGAPIYISCTNGNVLTAGDWLYAQYLARQFLEGPMEGMRAKPGEVRVIPVSLAGSGTHDCCGAATETVLNPVKGAKVTNVSMVHAYDKEYKSINRLLPVYRVSFDRPDGIRVYVETTQDRFSFAMDNRRAVFDEIFRIFHTWGWLDFLGKGRLAVEMLVALTALFTTVLGIYIFFTTRGPRVARNGMVKARRNHRYTAIVAALFTLMWTFSGSFHAFSKLRDDARDEYFVAAHFASDVTGFDLTRLQGVCPRPVTNISLVGMDGAAYWRVTMLPEKTATHKDLMKDRGAVLSPVAYVRTTDYSVIADGDKHYAAWMATQFSRRPAGEIRSVSPVTAFGDEYNFTDKRLPVWKVSYDAGGHERWYVETCSGRLSSKVDDRMVVEGYSFSVFHKHHFMDWGGKTARDASTMFWVLMQVILVMIGLILWFRRKRSLRPQAGDRVLSGSPVGLGKDDQQTNG